MAYVALATLGPETSWLSVAILLVPLGLSLALKQLEKWAEGGLIHTTTSGVRFTLIGAALYLAAVSGEPDQAGLRAAASAGLGLAIAGALLCIARQEPPPGLLQGHRAASSLDALLLSSALWSVCTIAFLVRAIAPDTFPLDPWSLDVASLFASLGSLLLVCASLLRVRLLRGLELGVSDRATAALALAIAGTAVTSGSGVLQLSTMDRLAGAASLATAIGVTACVAAPSPPLVTRTVRGLLALLLLGSPTALAGAWLTRKWPESSAEITLTTSAVCLIIGLLARAAAKPLAPEGSRWLGALSKAMDAALHPEPEMALRAALTELRKAEPRSKARPEIFRSEPTGLLSVDIAGYLEDRPVEFPSNVLDCALSEPSRTLRRETLEWAQVRQPAVRPLMTWFEAHQAKTATALCDDAGPVGLLVLPVGKRRSVLAIEEAKLLSQLSERLAGVVSVTSSLRRSRDREQGFRKAAEAALDDASTLRMQLQQQRRSDLSEAEARVQILRAAAHSPGAQIKLQELEAHAREPRLTLVTPIGVDPVPWAAHVHLSGSTVPRPLIVVDLGQHAAQSDEFWDEFYENERRLESSPLRRAKDGTLLLQHPGALPVRHQERLAAALEESAPSRLIACVAPSAALAAPLEKLLNGPRVALPTWEERPEDLQAFVLAELTQLGLSQRGQPLGIERAALYELVQRDFAGNDAELRGILAAAAAQTDGERVSLATILKVTRREEESAELSDPAEAPPGPRAGKRRTRMQPPPRARRH